jgi:hypothetical protein
LTAKSQKIGLRVTEIAATIAAMVARVLGARICKRIG